MKRLLLILFGVPQGSNMRPPLNRIFINVSGLGSNTISNLVLLFSFNLQIVEFYINLFE